MDVTATWMSPHKGSLQYISKVFKVDNAQLNKISPWEVERIIKNTVDVLYRYENTHILLYCKNYKGANTYLQGQYMPNSM